MKFVTDLELGKRIIINKYPEFNNCVFTADNTGWDNFVIKVDGKFIFRFPKREISYKTIEMEDRVLKHLNKVLPSNIKVPNFLYKNLDEDYPFVGYEMIKGKFLSQELYNDMSEDKKNEFIKNMMTFINTLHGMDIKSFELDVVDGVSNYRKRFNEFKEKCFEYFDDELKEKTNNTFNNYFNDEKMQKYSRTVIHGDLSTDHIIVTNDGVGIIDFGDVRVFDNMYDFQWLYMLDKEKLEEAIKQYNYEVNEYYHERLEFYTSIIPYYGVVYALETKNKEMLENEINKMKG